jgi:histidyl-tRNA synthetase
MNKPSLPQGTRDLTANTLRKRNYITSTIKHYFETYGYQPLETPALENLETLMGKYGEEGDKLIFKILNNGLNDPKNTDKAKAGFEKLLQGKNTTELTERALKYDLTIPFARFVAMHHNTLTLPFKRYQIQPVWRADRPQKGRYREFTQCDADIVGSKSLWYEVEFSNIYHLAFTQLGLTNYSLKINNRKILAALANACGGPQHLTNITVAIDKLDKIGLEKVTEELIQRGLTHTQIDSIVQFLNISGTNTEKLAAIAAMLGNNPTATEGITELNFVLANCLPQTNIEIDFTLARGLNYYTGTIFEVKAPNTVKIGSIAGGGRYDDLTGTFGVPNIPGVGISFGIDRIYDVLEELQLFPKDLDTGVTALFFYLGQTEAQYAFNIMQQLRQQNISCDMLFDNLKIGKQFNIAEAKQATYAVIIGATEMQAGQAQVKHLQTGVQQTIEVNDLAKFFKQ